MSRAEHASSLAEAAEAVGLAVELAPRGSGWTVRRGGFKLFEGSAGVVATWLDGYTGALTRTTEEEAVLDELATLEVVLLAGGGTQEDEERYHTLKSRIPPRWDVLQALRSLEAK